MSEQTPEAPTTEVAPEAPQEPEQQPATEPTDTDTDSAPAEDPEPESPWDPERAKAKIRKINAENKQLRERATQAEAKAAPVDDLQQQNATLGVENLRLKVGYELGLPINLAVRLQGATREEMVADAETLVDLISPKAAPAATRPVEALKPGASPSDTPAAQQDAYPADFLPRRMRERLADTNST